MPDLDLVSVFFPFAEFDFLKKALVASIILCLGSVPLGLFLILKRLSLVGDALSHSILPGVALGYFIYGFSLPAMTAGGLLAGLLIIFASTWVTQKTGLKQESSFASFYLISLSFGVLAISVRGNQGDLHHVLFGNLLSVDQSLLILIGVVASVSVLFVSIFYRALVLEAFDVGAFKSVQSQRPFSKWIPWLFLGLIVLNLVASFHAIGTLLSLGLMVLPAATALLWAKNIQKLILLGLGFAVSSCYLGLLISYHFDLSIGPTIVLAMGVFYLVSLVQYLFTRTRIVH